MALSTPPSGAWHDWGSDDLAAVTSTPLSGDAPVGSRWFPKIRSWLALGAPLELLSPLSIARAVVLAGALGWPLLVAGDLRQLRAAVAVLVATAAYGAASWRLLHMRRIGLQASWWLTVAAIVLDAGVAALAAPSAVAVEYLLLAGPWCAFAALFFSARRVACTVALVGAAATVVSLLSPGGRITLPLAVVVALASMAAPLRLVAAAAQRGGTVDADTGLPNGRGLDQQVARRGIRGRSVAAVLALSGIPEVREALGHEAATGLLRRAVEDVGQVLPPGGLVGRVEGDDLVVIQPIAQPTPDSACADLATAEAERLGRRLLLAVSGRPYLVGDLEISLGARVGLAVAAGESDGVPELLRRATEASRRAAASGQAVRLWDGRRDALTAGDLALLADLRVAADRGELSMAYQPQVASGDGRVVGVEALMRWESPTRGRVSPGRFVPLAERTGLIDRLTEWSLGEVLDAQARWREAGVGLPVSFNLSAKQLSQPEISGWILGALGERCLPASALTVEMTETAAATADVADIVALLEPLHAAGVGVSVDDFGTGYTSLGVLSRLPVDELKVDHGFVQRSVHSERDDAIVRSIRDLAGRLGLRSVAEGVESQECARRMASYGFDLLQGYHFARPLAEADLLDAVAGLGQPVPAAP